MENTTATTMYEHVLIDAKAAVDITADDLVAHELAHQWFGDLVTMEWWDDLWLNESFAEWASTTCQAEATEWVDAWTTFQTHEKDWAYRGERAPTTHPVAGAPADNAQDALANFDGISYAKGASVLRQLIAHIGDEAFVAGVTAYLNAHAFGNGELREFLAAMSRAAGVDLTNWSGAWLETAGADTISTELGGWVGRRVSPDHPADRPHTLDVAGWSDGAEVFRVPVRVTGDWTHDEALAVAPPAAVVVPNASDLTWADVDLAPATLSALTTQLGAIPDATARAVVWSALLGGVYRGTVDPRLALDVFTAAAPQERHDGILARVSTHLTDRIIPCFLPPEAGPSAVGRVAGVGYRVLREAVPGSAQAVVAARLVARTTTDEDRLRAWLDGLRKAGIGRLVLLASSMPESQALKADTEVVLRRHEIALWESLLRELPWLVFGDYGIVHPNFAHLRGSGAPIPAPKARYATPNSWIVIKGHRPKKGEASQYRKIARRIVAADWFRPNDFGWGAERIRLAATTQKREFGSHACWVGFCTQIHLAITMRQVRVAVGAAARQTTPDESL